MAFKIVHKNTCAPEEKVNFSSGYRWSVERDSPVKRFSGCGKIDLTTIDTYSASTAVDTNATTIANGSQDYVFIKNLGGGSGNDIYITLDNSNYLIMLSSGECFSSRVSTSSVIKAKCLSGDTTIQFLEGT